MRQNRHCIAAYEHNREKDEFFRRYCSFESLYRRRRYKEAGAVLDGLFVLCYESHPDRVCMLLLAKAAVAAECGEIVKAIRLNRDLLGELRKNSLTTAIERMASCNLIYDLKSFGYSVGAITEARLMANREFAMLRTGSGIQP